MQFDVNQGDGEECQPFWFFNKNIIFTKVQLNNEANIFSIIFVLCKLWNQKN